MIWFSLRAKLAGGLLDLLDPTARPWSLISEGLSTAPWRSATRLLDQVHMTPHARSGSSSTVQLAASNQLRPCRTLSKPRHHAWRSACCVAMEKRADDGACCPSAGLKPALAHHPQGGDNGMSDTQPGLGPAGSSHTERTLGLSVSSFVPIRPPLIGSHPDFNPALQPPRSNLQTIPFTLRDHLTNGGCPPQCLCRACLQPAQASAARQSDKSAHGTGSRPGDQSPEPLSRLAYRPYGRHCAPTSPRDKFCRQIPTVPTRSG